MHELKKTTTHVVQAFNKIIRLSLKVFLRTFVYAAFSKIYAAFFKKFRRAARAAFFKSCAAPRRAALKLRRAALKRRRLTNTISE